MSLITIAMAAALAGPVPDTGAQAPAAATSPASEPVLIQPAPTPAPAQALDVQSDEGGNIVVTGRGKPPPGDPLQNVNAKSFEAVQFVDRAAVGPIAHGYMAVVPSPLRSGVHNVLVELEQPTIFVNFLLQHKVGKAAETLARFAINATLGLGGLIDVAKTKTFKLPHRPNGFAYTMGFYGVGSGPYLYLPLIGSTSLRDVTGRMMDLSLLGFVVGKPFSTPYYSIGKGVMSSIDDRVQLDGVIKRLRDDNPDPYAAMKKYYLDKRQAEIDALRGRTTPPVPGAVPITPVPAG